MCADRGVGSLESGSFGLDWALMLGTLLGISGDELGTR
jgi:hypothetical protein